MSTINSNEMSEHLRSTKCLPKMPLKSRSVYAFLRQALCGCKDIWENMDQVPAYSGYEIY